MDARVGADVTSKDRKMTNRNAEQPVFGKLSVRGVHWRHWLLTTLMAVCAVRPALSLELQNPVACDLGQECHIMQVVDRDNTDAAKDFLCGTLTYDTHKGVDFGLSSWALMAEGVDVLAVTGGTVRAIRDGMSDRSGYRKPNGDVGGRECGNGVVIDHEGGWSTQYCHMRRGSILVRSGDRVESGQPLGLVGASGKADFPHLHLVVRNNGNLIDPFDGRNALDECEARRPTGNLWSDSAGIVFRPGGVLSEGFLDRVPEYPDVWNDAISTDILPTAAPAIVAWGHFFGLRAGDVIDIQILAPSGEEFSRDRYEMPRNRATQFRAVGRRLRGNEWPTGVYTSKVSLIRDGSVIEERTGKVTLQ